MKLTRFVFHNLMRQKRSIALSTVGIILGASSVMVFLALDQGLRENVLKQIFVVDQLEVVPRRVQLGIMQETGSLFGGGTGLNDYTIDDLYEMDLNHDEIPDGLVAAVYPKMQISFPSMAYGGEEILGQRARVELIADGIPEALIRAELPVPEQPFNAFRDWDSEDFICTAPGSEGHGLEVGCPPGRRCDDNGECVRVECVPRDEVLAAPSQQLIEDASDFLRERVRVQGRRRLSPRRHSLAIDQPEIRQIEISLQPQGDPHVWRLAINEDYLDQVLRILPTYLVHQGAQRRVDIALDLASSALEHSDEPSEFVLVVPPVIDPIILSPQETGCSDEPCFCGAVSRRCEMPIPVIGSPFFLELYNTNIQTILSGSTASMPQIPPDNLYGFTFWVEFGRSFHGFGRADLVDDAGVRQHQVRLVGWSPRAMQVGLTMPLEYVRRLNELYKGEESAREYHSLLVVAREGEDLARIARFVEEPPPDGLNLSIGPSYENAKRGSLMITIMTVGLLVISLLILLLAALNIAHTFFMVVTERRREIGVLRAIGARRSSIWFLVVAEAGFVGVLGAALSAPLAIGLARLADDRLTSSVPDFPFKPDSLFLFEPWVFAVGLGVSVLFALVGAFFPAYRAARMDPAEALRAE